MKNLKELNDKIYTEKKQKNKISMYKLRKEKIKKQKEIKKMNISEYKKKFNKKNIQIQHLIDNTKITNKQIRIFNTQRRGINLTNLIIAIQENFKHFGLFKIINQPKKNYGFLPSDVYIISSNTELNNIKELIKKYDNILMYFENTGKYIELFDYIKCQ